MTEEKKHYKSSWYLSPTVRQLATITRLCEELHIPEPTPAPTNRWQAKGQIWKLEQKRKEA